ncbi:unnamed protein product [Didymodactylos carnosus]|uniref:RING-type domain-containing protein n=1 Tax=Didymodactylos carnosus TaxID=1234261 RepID=A0A815BNZ4_9BILA|nr:unnamed protein product [Didymodactylos carnosus]CAF4057227.1 unnamed protein product [Didymodactylos carnosus]
MSRVSTQPQHSLNRNGVPLQPKLASFVTSVTNAHKAFKLKSGAQKPLAKVVIQNCAICNKPYTDPRVLPCSHTFCLDCIENKLIKNNSLTCEKCFDVQSPFDEQRAQDLPKNMILDPTQSKNQLLSQKSFGATYGSKSSIGKLNQSNSTTSSIATNTQQQKTFASTQQPTEIQFLETSVHDRTSEATSRTSSTNDNGFSRIQDLQTLLRSDGGITNLVTIFSDAKNQSENPGLSASSQKYDELTRIFREATAVNRTDDHYEEITWDSLVNGNPHASPLPENSQSHKTTSETNKYSTIASIVKPFDDDEYENRYRTLEKKSSIITNDAQNSQEIITPIQRSRETSSTSSPIQQRKSYLDQTDIEHQNKNYSPRHSNSGTEPIQGHQLFNSQISHDSTAIAKSRIGQTQDDTNAASFSNYNKRESINSQRNISDKRSNSRNDNTRDNDDNYSTPTGTDRPPSRQGSVQQQLHQDHGYSAAHDNNTRYRPSANRVSVASSSTHGNDQQQDRPSSVVSSDRQSSTSKRDSIRSESKFQPLPSHVKEAKVGSNKRSSSASSSTKSYRSADNKDRFNPDSEFSPLKQPNDLESGSTTPTGQRTPRQDDDDDQNYYARIDDQRRISNISDRSQQRRFRTNSGGNSESHYLAPELSTYTPTNFNRSSSSYKNSFNNNNNLSRSSPMVSSNSLIVSNVTSKVENLLHDQKHLEQEIEDTLKRLTYDYEDIKTQIEKKESAIHAEVKHISKQLDKGITEHYYRKQKIYSSLADQTQSVGNELKRLKQTDQYSIQQLITGNKLWDNLEQLEQNIQQIRSAVENEKGPQAALKFEEGKRALTADTIGQITYNDNQQQWSRRQISSYDDTYDRNYRIQQLFHQSIQPQALNNTTALTPNKSIKIDHLSNLEPEAIAIVNHSNKILLGICNELFILNDYGEVLKKILLTPSIRGIAISKKQSTSNIAYISNDETVSMIDIENGKLIDCVKETNSHGQSGTFLPLGIDTDDIHGHVYVCDYLNSCIIKFDDKLEFLTQWRVFNQSDNYDEARPKLISVYGTKLYMIVEHCKPSYDHDIAYTFSLQICDSHNGQIIKIIDDQLLLTQRLRWPCSVQAINDEKCYILDTMTSGKYFNGQWQKHWSRVLEIQSQGQPVTELFQLDSEVATMAMSKQTMIIATNDEILYVDLKFILNTNNRDKGLNSISSVKPRTTSSSSTITKASRTSKIIPIDDDSSRYMNITTITNDYNNGGGQYDHDYRNS